MAESNSQLSAAQQVEPASRLLSDLRTLIEEARARAVQSVNSTLVQLYWRIGHRISTELLKGDRAERRCRDN